MEPKFLYRMIYILPNANYNKFQAVFRRCITTEIRVETLTNPCTGVMHYSAVGQVFGLSFALSFLSCFALIYSSSPNPCNLIN
jgi:hypothetical protein